MNQADKQEALRLLGAVPEIGLKDVVVLGRLRQLIERQDDKDGERWRFCLEHGFPVVGGGGVCVVYKSIPFMGDTPNEATDAAMAAMKEKA